MAYPKRQDGFVSQVLQFNFEQAHARTIGTAAIRRDHRLVHVGIALWPMTFSQHPIELTANCAVSLPMPRVTQAVLAAMP